MKRRETSKAAWEAEQQRVTESRNQVIQAMHEYLERQTVESAEAAKRVSKRVHQLSAYWGKVYDDLCSIEDVSLRVNALAVLCDGSYLLAPEVANALMSLLDKAGKASMSGYLSAGVAAYIKACAAPDKVYIKGEPLSDLKAPYPKNVRPLIARKNSKYWDIFETKNDYKDLIRNDGC